MIPRKFKILILDDEVENVRMLEKIVLTHCPDMEIVASCLDSVEAVEITHNMRPDIVFLDISMPILNGFDFLNQFEKIWFKIIFTTAYSEHALKAIKYAAFDYILKPLDSKDVLEAINKFKASNGPNHISEISRNIKANTNLALPTSDGLSFIDIAEILYCKSDNSYTNFFLKDGKKVLVCRGLKETMKTLDGHNFFRIHQSYLVNIKFIKKYQRHTSSIHIINGEELPLAVRKKEEFLQFITRL